MKDPRLVFLDLETTGLDPERDQILELGLVVTTPELEEIAAWSSVIGHDAHPEDLVPDAFVRAMHEKSGLIEDIRRQVMLSSWRERASEPPHRTPTYVERTALSVLRDFGLARGTTLAGFSVHFDRSFLHRHMPTLDRFFDYRMLDVSALKCLEDRWVGERPKTEPAHRALPDCRAAIEYLRSHRWRFAEPFAEPPATQETP